MTFNLLLLTQSLLKVKSFNRVLPDRVHPAINKRVHPRRTGILQLHMRTAFAIMLTSILSVKCPRSLPIVQFLIAIVCS